MHGIPVLVKDNVATQDRMETTAGSAALLGSVVPRDAFAARQLRKAGAVLLGKTNLSEWANFRSLQSSSGWSGRAGQCLNPYVLDRDPSGSSSGSGAASRRAWPPARSAARPTARSCHRRRTTACAVSSRRSASISRSGVIPISHNQDTLGPDVPHGRRLGRGPRRDGRRRSRDPATKASKGHFYRDYTQFLDPHGLQGARIGVWRDGVFGFSPEGDAVADQPSR